MKSTAPLAYGESFISTRKTRWSNVLFKKLFNISNLCRIFRLKGFQKMLRGPIFRGWQEILVLGKALKFWVIFKKFALKLIKFCKILGKPREKCKNFGRFLEFLAGNNFFHYRKNKELISTGSIDGFGRTTPPPHEPRKIFTNFVEIGNGKLKHQSHLTNCMNFWEDLKKL